MNFLDDFILELGLKAQFSLVESNWNESGLILIGGPFFFLFFSRALLSMMYNST